MENQTNPQYGLYTDLHQYLAILWRWLWLLILSTILAGASAYVVSSYQDPVYQATTTVLINEASNTQTSDYTSLLVSERLARTYSQMLTKRPVLEKVIQLLSLQSDVETLKKAIEVQLVRDTQLIEIKVENTNPALAADIANTLVNVFSLENENLQASRYSESLSNLSAQLNLIDQQIQATRAKLNELGEDPAYASERDRLNTVLSGYMQTYSQLLQSYEQVRLAKAQSTSNILQVEPASVPVNPIRPRILLNTALAAVVGLMLAVGVVFLIEYLDTSIRNPEDIERALSIPIIGFIPETSAKSDGRFPTVLAQPRSPMAEAFRTLRINLEHASNSRNLKTILVTSAAPDEGKTTTAVNLALIMAKMDKRVVLLDADFRRPQVHKHLGVSNRTGLSSIFLSNLPISQVARSWKMENLAVITSGALPPNPSEILGSKKMEQFIVQLKNQADLIIIDSPPNLVSDAAALATHVDGVILVVQPGKTQIPAIVSLTDQLKRINVNTIGVVFNRIPRSRSYYYYKYYAPYTSGDYRHNGYFEEENEGQT